ncbi:hypothetical protein GCM10010232_02910 [Streptomyces amakusaensis]
MAAADPVVSPARTVRRETAAVVVRMVNSRFLEDEWVRRRGRRNDSSFTPGTPAIPSADRHKDRPAAPPLSADRQRAPPYRTPVR